jgi:hypothetical protein
MPRRWIADSKDHCPLAGSRETPTSQPTRDLRAGIAAIGPLPLLMEFPDLFHHPIEIFDQSVMAHKHLASGGY